MLSPVRFILYTTTQPLALMAKSRASVVWGALLLGPLPVSTTPGASTIQAQGIFIEGFITCGLILSLLFLVVDKPKAILCPHWHWHDHLCRLLSTPASGGFWVYLRELDLWDRSYARVSISARNKTQTSRACGQRLYKREDMHQDYDVFSGKAALFFGTY
ncbi:hypothetical protein PSTG_12166 [Puccinia striiformis f. sp. tritici PST-78]|uniref:Uncharacterized protein n=1 Tax=Puccinia striiformis f. sp. tritici PST-78 TaxID=1165861 RepID=A0A0L0V5F3_9BASI|nr:hypothetical protein PSTG_12166 [Puccinia striiformis f. sp. tritici PST-78]